MKTELNLSQTSQHPKVFDTLQPWSQYRDLPWYQWILTDPVCNKSIVDYYKDSTPPLEYLSGPLLRHSKLWFDRSCIRCSMDVDLEVDMPLLRLLVSWQLDRLKPHIILPIPWDYGTHANRFIYGGELNNGRHLEQVFHLAPNQKQLDQDDIPGALQFLNSHCRQLPPRKC